MNAHISGNNLMAPLLAVLMVFAMLFAMLVFGPTVGPANDVTVAAIGGTMIAPVIAHITTPHVPIIEMMVVGLTLAAMTSLPWIRRSVYLHNIAKITRGFWSSNYGTQDHWTSNYDTASSQGALAGGDSPNGSPHFVRT